MKRLISWLRRDAEIAGLKAEISELKRKLADAQWKVLKYEIEGRAPDVADIYDARSNAKFVSYHLHKTYGGRS